MDSLIHQWNHGMFYGIEWDRHLMAFGWIDCDFKSKRSGYCTTPFFSDLRGIDSMWGFPEINHPHSRLDTFRYFPWKWDRVKCPSVMVSEMLSLNYCITVSFFKYSDNKIDDAWPDVLPFGMAGNFHKLESTQFHDFRSYYTVKIRGFWHFWPAMFAWEIATLCTHHKPPKAQFWWGTWWEIWQGTWKRGLEEELSSF